MIVYHNPRSLCSDVIPSYNIPQLSFEICGHNVAMKDNISGYPLKKLLGYRCSSLPSIFNPIRLLRANRSVPDMM